MKHQWIVLLMLAVLLPFQTHAAQLGRTSPPVTHNAAGGGIYGPATGLQIALLAPVQLFSPRYSVSGFRFNILYGRNMALRGMDIGLVNDITEDAEGLQLGLGNMAGGLTGLQLGALNFTTDVESGALQLGAFNMGGNFQGVQLGAINMAQDMNGVQIGVINMCDTTTGCQIGVLNFIFESDILIFCPLFNAEF